MNTIIRNTAAVLAGLVFGSLVNMGLVNVGPTLIPLPAGADVTTMEGLQKSMSLFTPANFLFPFLAHALGTLVGAFVAAKIGISHKRKLALGIGFFFLAGGITMVIMVGGPLWFCIADLVLAYLPMGLLGGMLAAGPSRRSNQPGA